MDSRTNDEVREKSADGHTRQAREDGDEAVEAPNLETLSDKTRCVSDRLLADSLLPEHVSLRPVYGSHGHMPINTRESNAAISARDLKEG